MATTRVAEIAADIQKSVGRIDHYLLQHGLPSPSFDEDGPVDFKIADNTIQAAREKAIDLSLELHQLLLGPSLCLRPVLNGVSLQAIYRYDIAMKVPVHGEISFAELSRQCGLDEMNLRRIVRFAIAFHRVFQESRNGFVSHSAASRKLAEDPLARAGLGYMFDEVWQSYAQTIEARERYKSDDPHESGWCLAMQTDKTIWEYYATHPDMASRFAKAMSLAAESSAGHRLSPAMLVKAYPWASIGKGKGTIVDVGGSQGKNSVALAESSPGLKFVVQDLPDAMRGAKDALPAEIAPRIEFMEHDFFTPQAVEADVYLFCNIFHDWSDTYAIKILRATIPALKPQARVIVNDYVIPDPNSLPPSKERDMRAMDMIMLTLFNSREREQDDWRKLFQQADPRFREVNIWAPDGGSSAMIEAVWSE